MQYVTYPLVNLNKYDVSNIKAKTGLKINISLVFKSVWGRGSTITINRANNEEINPINIK